MRGGGSVCQANLGGLCLHSGGSWRLGFPPSSNQVHGTFYSYFSFTKIKLKKIIFMKFTVLLIQGFENKP